MIKLSFLVATFYIMAISGCGGGGVGGGSGESTDTGWKTGAGGYQQQYDTSNGEYNGPVDYTRSPQSDE